eukprot:9268896-Ditylum_brightwellii.AAC.1
MLLGYCSLFSTWFKTIGQQLGKPIDCLLMPDVQIPRQRFDMSPLGDDTHSILSNDSDNTAN